MYVNSSSICVEDPICPAGRKHANSAGAARQACKPTGAAAVVASMVQDAKLQLASEAAL